MNTIGDMRNEKYFYDHCIEFVYNHDYEKSDDDKLYSYTLNFKKVVSFN